MSGFGFRRLTRKIGLIDGDKLVIGLMAFLVLAIVLGGASRGHALRLTVLELAALPLLGAAVLRLWSDGRWRDHLGAIGIVVAVAAVPLLQLAPLPPQLWQALPGREQAALALEVARVVPGWSPYSLAPDLTWRSALALLPPIAVFLSVLAVREDPGRKLSLLVLGLAGMNVALGLAQLVSGSNALHPWDTTGAGDMTGFFANRNHLATLVLVALPFCGLWIGRSARAGLEKRTRLWLWAAFSALLLFSLVIIRSRAGVALALPVIVLSTVVGFMAANRRVLGLRLVAGVATMLVAVTAFGWVAGGTVMDRRQAVEAEGRFENWPLVVGAAQAHLPAGAGMGSFDRVFRSIEPLETLDATFFNRAHNDYLETWLEAGWIAAAILVAFMVWFGRRVVGFRRPPGRGGWAAPAAAAAIIPVLAHSFVDYPMRTVAMTAMFALCCALVERRPAPAHHARPRDAEPVGRVRVRVRTKTGT